MVVDMTSARCVLADGSDWLGYFEEFPDYVTQGQNLEDLRENLKALYQDLTSGEIRGIRRIAELSFP
jgi:predicted RNase H-like HicB family nuclease